MSSISSNFSPGALTTNERRRVALVALAVVGFVVAAYALTRGELPDPARPVSLLLGAALGFAFERGRFCFFCLYRDAFERRITRPLLSIVTAIAVGAVGYALMFGLYLPNPKGEGLPPAAHISPVSLPLVAGACAFGCGMVLSGACISGHLYRIGQGYLRAIPALVGALVGFGLGFFTWNTLYLEQVSESPVLWLPRWLGYSGSLVLLLAVLGVVAWVLMRLDRSEPVAPRSVSAAPTPHFDVLFARRWSPVATGVVVGAIGIAAYLRSTPLGVTSQLSTVSRSYLDSREMLPEVLHGIDMMRGCVAIVAS
ncbi:MAG: YeeE/YedE thiosulfate transporter family protein, partial [Ilumatobacteraceae bacterium]